MSNFKPMLAGKVTDLSTLTYPVIISPKLDGYRALNLGDGKIVSRNIKPFPNEYVQELFGSPALRYFDGELIVGDPTAKSVFNASSAVMKKEGTPDVRYYIFDHFEHPHTHFSDRLKHLPNPLPKGCVLVEQRLVFTEDALLEWETKWLQMGYEGVMIRSFRGGYKFGRSTDREGTLLKLKRFSDDDCQIVGVEELLSNQNEATKDALGRTERSSHAEGKVPANTLGALIVKDVKSGVEFNIGTGFDAKARAQIWADHLDIPVPFTLDGITTEATPSGEPVIGRFGKYKHFAVGAIDKPRFPVWLGFRNVIDVEGATT